MPSIAKSRGNEVTDSKNVARYSSYVKISDEELTKLQDATNRGDSSEMRSILARNSLFEVNDNLMNVYDPLVGELAKKVIDSNAHRLGIEGRRQARRGEFKPKIKAPVRRARVTTKRITQRTKKGVEYKRDNPVSFKTSEVTFIKNNQDLGNKEIVKRYNELFKVRSGSSIVTKKYRLRKEKKRKRK